MWSLFSLYETFNWLFPSNSHFLPDVPIVIRCNSESRNQKCIQIQRRSHFQGNRPCWLCRRGWGIFSLGDTKSALSNKRRTNPDWWNHKPNLSPYLSWRVWRLLICSLDNQTKNDQNFELEKTMKFRGRSSISADDKVVSTAVAKKRWFLKDLSGLPSLKAGWNGPTFYAVKDLDRLALKVHGPEALAKKKQARQKRLDKKTEKAPKKNCQTSWEEKKKGTRPRSGRRKERLWCGRWLASPKEASDQRRWGFCSWWARQKREEGNCTCHWKQSTRQCGSSITAKKKSVVGWNVGATRLWRRCWWWFGFEVGQKWKNHVWKLCHLWMPGAFDM